jgi:N-acetylglutamate synthase-like GNAT family acetyltransferase
VSHKSAKVAEVTVRQATSADVHAIHACLEPFVQEGKILRRALNELHDMIGQYIVAEMNGEIVGCVVLEIYSKKLCEIRSLAVHTNAQGTGIGKKLVQACLERAKKESILEVMAVTSSEHFFKSCGFDFTLPGEKKALFYLP